MVAHRISIQLTLPEAVLLTAVVARELAAYDKKPIQNRTPRQAGSQEILYKILEELKQDLMDMADHALGENLIAEQEEEKENDQPRQSETEPRC